MTIQQDVLKSEIPVLIELFKVDLSKTNEPGLAGSILYLTPMTNAADISAPQPVSFGGNSYSPFPLQITGIESSSEGAPARPTLAVSNISKYFGGLVFAYNDIIGAEVTYIRTFSTYLNTSSEISMPPMRYQIAKKVSHNKAAISFELRSFNDKERAFMPKRQMLKKDFPGLGINKYVR